MRRALQLIDKSMCLPRDTLAAVLEGLSLHAARGDLDSVAAVHLYLHHQSPTVRKTAIAAVGQLAPVDDATSMAHLRRNLGCLDMEVQLAAFAALARVAARGNQQVIKLINEKSMDGNVAIRC